MREIKRVEIEIIEHSKQRPEAGETAGDWFFSQTIDGLVLHLRVSRLPETKHSLLIACHELFEAVACHFAKVEPGAVDEFDSSWKEHDGYQEPGDDPLAPYHHQHMSALIAERLLAQELNVDWTQYEKQMFGLFEKKE